MIPHPKHSKNALLNLTFGFSLEIIEFTEQLEQSKKFNMANQLFRSATSIGANSNESQNCESRSDFIHKLKIAAKEACETEYWLLLCKHAENYPETGPLLEKLEEIQKILNRIISTAKMNR